MAVRVAPGITCGVMPWPAITVTTFSICAGVACNFMTTSIVRTRAEGGRRKGKAKQRDWEGGFSAVRRPPSAFRLASAAGYYTRDGLLLRGGGMDLTGDDHLERGGDGTRRAGRSVPHQPRAVPGEARARRAARRVRRRRQLPVVGARPGPVRALRSVPAVRAAAVGRVAADSHVPQPRAVRAGVPGGPAAAAAGRSGFVPVGRHRTGEREGAGGPTRPSPATPTARRSCAGCRPTCRRSSSATPA